jgi:DNA-binding response OmpR family regulator
MEAARRPLALVVDDVAEFAELSARALREDGFEVTVVGDGESAVRAARHEAPDLIVLDLNLPGIDGIETCRSIRTFSDAYVLMVTGREAEVDRLIGLSVGADDYLTKPFFPRELVARARAMLRRPRADQTAAAPAARRFGDLTIDPEAREVTVAGRPVALSRLEFDLLAALSEHPRASVSRDQLIERVWGGDWFGDTHVVDVHVSNLRRKLGDDPVAARYIRTIRGYGFRMGDG